MPLRLLITGSRDWTDRTAIINALRRFGVANISLLMHGAARGADTMAAEEAVALGLHRGKVRPYLANWDMGKAAGPIRNQFMLENGNPECALAFQGRGEWNAGGTGDMLERLMFAEVPTFITFNNRVTVAFYGHHEKGRAKDKGLLKSTDPLSTWVDSLLLKDAVAPAPGASPQAKLF